MFLGRCNEGSSTNSTVAPLDVSRAEISAAATDLPLDGWPHISTKHPEGGDAIVATPKMKTKVP